MKVLVCDKPGELSYQEIDEPVAAAGQAILKVKRIGICGTDLHAYEGTQPFFNYPRVLGHELALEVIDAEGFEKATNAELKPQKLENTLAFMFESRYVIRPTKFALESNSLQKNYHECWQGLQKNFKM